MAHSRSALKRARQNARRRDRHRAARTRLRSEMKKLIGLIKTADAAKAQAQFRLTSRLLDKAALRGLIHLNKAARHKSRFAAAVARLAPKS